MGRLRAVLFDLDDTLVDHTGASTAALHGWLPTLGAPSAQIDELIEFWVELEHRHWPAWRVGEISHQEQRRRRLRDFLPAVGQRVDEDTLDSIFDGYLVGYRLHWAAFTDAAPALERVASLGLRIGVLTNGKQEQQVEKLVATRLIDLCGTVFASSSLPAGKPDPRAYHEACRQLDVAPEETLMVGDNYDLDVLAAQSAGLSAIHLNRTTKNPSDEKQIASLADLPL